MHKESRLCFIKRIGNVWDEICSYENLKLAHKNASKKKHWYGEVKMVNSDLDKYLKELQQLLKTGSYRTSNYIKEVRMENGKMRNIYKLPYYPDRIAQWAVLQVIDKHFINNFIEQTYSAIPDRGIHKAAHKLKDDLMYNDMSETTFCLKGDISKYYESINHQKLKEKLKHKFKDKQLLDFLFEIIDSISTHPTLPDTGIPIGNYASQYFGNFYLSEFDHWIKEEKHCRYYYRYMDDIVILSDNKIFLHQLRAEIDSYLQNELKLTLKPNWQVFPVDERGIDFVGYVFRHSHILLRKSTKVNMCKKLRAISKKQDISYSDYCCFNSYKGWLEFCDGKNLYKKHLKPLEEKMRFFYFTEIKSKKKGRNKKCNT